VARVPLRHRRVTRPDSMRHYARRSSYAGLRKLCFTHLALGFSHELHSIIDSLALTGRRLTDTAAMPTAGGRIFAKHDTMPIALGFQRFHYLNDRIVIALLRIVLWLRFKRVGGRTTPLQNLQRDKSPPRFKKSERTQPRRRATSEFPPKPGTSRVRAGIRKVPFR